MYSEDIYYTFQSLRDQLYRCKTTKWSDKYSKIEFEQRKYVTFRRFCWACEDYFSWRYRDEPTLVTVQEIFDECLELSAKRQLHLCIFWY